MTARVSYLKNKAKAEARLWERLEILPDDVQKHALITPILTKSLGSIDKTIEYLRESDAKEAIEVLRVWDLGSKNEHSKLPFEAYCLAAHTTPKKMIGIIMQAVVEHGNTASDLMLAAAHPEVVQKVVKVAKTAKGVGEREIILKNRGVIATPKNNVFNNFGSMTQDNRKQLAVGLGQLSEDDDNISRAVDTFNEQRQLGKGMPKVEVIDVTAED